MPTPRVRESNFSLKGLLGLELHGRKVGIIGTGLIGYLAAKILNGFGCEIYGYDIHENPKFHELGGQYLSLDELYAQMDICPSHCPLNEHTYHLLDDEAFNKMKPGMMVINTGRGAIIDTQPRLTPLSLATSAISA